MRSTTVRFALAAAMLVSALASAPRAASGTSLYDAVRRNDVTAATTLMAQGADVKSADETGATPLMYAALYAGPEILAALIDHGAPVNASNTYGATALMWAAAHTANVQLLVRRGADVNAKASDGVTPLVAASRYSNADAMKILLAAGADTSAPETRTNLLTAAYFATTPAVRDLLRSVGVVVKGQTDVKGPVLNRSRGNLPALTELLAAGIDPRRKCR